LTTPLLTIDPEKCSKDGLCAMACPMALLSFADTTKPPVPVPNARELCIRCGHCVAVCPKGAIDHEAMKASDCLPIQKKLLLSAEHAEHFLRSRRSIRNYKDAPVEREKLERLITIASHAQTGHNEQPVKWLVIYEKEKVHQLAEQVIAWMKHLLKTQKEFAKALHMDMIVAAWLMGFDVVFRNAPHVVLAYSHKASATAPTASIIAMTYLELAAPTLGLGTCWAGYFTYASQTFPPLMEALNLPKNHVAQQGVMVGIPKFGYQRMPVRKSPDITFA
jgi:nitroreductase/NAD-dependent dihydropyrimidine dehydrogenase PreA subunit